jgi:23S rRNA pseudouridine1911/1915/1917 synthase
MGRASSRSAPGRGLGGRRSPELDRARRSAPDGGARGVAGGAERARVERAFDVPEALGGRPLDGILRAVLEAPWSRCRSLIESGKVRVSGVVITRPDAPAAAGAAIEIVPSAPRPETVRDKGLERDLVVYLDSFVVVVRKPAGISTVPFGDEPPEEQRAALDAVVRRVLQERARGRGGQSSRGRGPRAPLGVVQRLDKETSGLIVFARTFAAKKELTQQLRRRTVFRRYLAIAHGDVGKRTFRSHLVEDRGDGLRGSAERAAGVGGERQLAVTHVEPVERLAGATLIACRLETGRTHQIRIHLAEAGHPLVGEQVYVREFSGPRVAAPRLMLHAAELGFEHPADGRTLRFSAPPPADFAAVLATLRR